MGQIDPQQMADRQNIDQEAVEAVLDGLVDTGWLFEEYIDR